MELFELKFWLLLFVDVVSDECMERPENCFRLQSLFFKQIALITIDNYCAVNVVQIHIIKF